MHNVSHAIRIRLSAVAFLISGILFVLYPAIRPFSDETSLQGATAFASSEWLVAHMLGMLAFTLLPVGMLGFYITLQGTIVQNLGYWGLILGLIGTGLTLPFYGGEANGLHAIGQEALRQQNTSLVSLANVVRSGPGLGMFLIGLSLLAVAGSLRVCGDKATKGDISYYNGWIVSELARSSHWALRRKAFRSSFPLSVRLKLF